MEVPQKMSIEVNEVLNSVDNGSTQNGDAIKVLYHPRQEVTKWFNTNKNTLIKIAKQNEAVSIKKRSH